jgi:hypothetical protein
VGASIGGSGGGVVSTSLLGAVVVSEDEEGAAYVGVGAMNGELVAGDVVRVLDGGWGVGVEAGCMGDMGA